MAKLRESPNVSAAAKAARIDRSYVYQVRNEDLKFAREWDDAISASVEVAEGELYRRGVKGVRKPVYQSGKLVGHIQEYSDACLIFLLKCHKPSVYRDVVRQEHAGVPGQPVIVRGQVVTEMSDADLDSRTDELIQKREGGTLAPLGGAGTPPPAAPAEHDPGNAGDAPAADHA